MKKRILFLIPILAVLLSVNNVFAAEGDFEYLRLIKASNSSTEPFYSYLPSNSNSNINIQVDSDRHALGTDPSRVLVLHACSINLSDMKINNIVNSYGYVSQQGATIYNSIEDCTFYLGGNKYFGTYQYWYFPIQSSYFNDSDGTYNLNFTVDVYNTFDTGVRFLEAYTYIKIPNSILEADAVAKQYIQQQTIINQNQATNDKLDDMLNADADASVNPDDSKYDDYESAEGSLKDKVNQANLSNLSIGIDSNSSKWVWETLTSLLQAHSAIFGMVIAILSIGVIKLALGR